MSLSTSEKRFQILWQPIPGTTTGASETQDYALSSKIYYIMPQLGLGYRISHSFDFYGSVGLGFTRFTYTEDFTVLIGTSAGQSSNGVFKARGTAPGIIVGGKYRFPLGKKRAKKKVHGFVKLEFMMLKVNSLKGSKSFASEGTVGEELQDATFYRFEWNPFGLGWFDYWDAFEADPIQTDKRNIQKMGLNLSSVRFMIGISF
jgi:opacity protein-like surface antigen